jgi:hypothetical protein
MPDRFESVDVSEVLASMRPDAREEESTWPIAHRDAMLDQVLAEQGGRRRRIPQQMARYGWVAASAAAAMTLVILLFPGVLGLTRPIQAVPAQPQPIPTGSATPSFVCRGLDDRQRNDVGVMNQTYHGVDPEDGVVASAAVDAGLGYSVIGTRLTTGQKTAWLTWVTDVHTNKDGEVTYALHLAEITSGTAWNGGPAPYGREALAAALTCVT